MSRAISNIVAFTCNWGAYAGIEIAGANRREYPAGIRLVRVPCLGRIELGLVLRAFEKGAGGVMLLGCPGEECHYGTSANRARVVFSQARKTMRLLGLEPKRLQLVEVPAGSNGALVKQAAAFAKYINQTGS